MFQIESNFRPITIMKIVLFASILLIPQCCLSLSCKNDTDPSSRYKPVKFEEFFANLEHAKWYNAGFIKYRMLGEHSQCHIGRVSHIARARWSSTNGTLEFASSQMYNCESYTLRRDGEGYLKAYMFNSSRVIGFYEDSDAFRRVYYKFYENVKLNIYTEFLMETVNQNAPQVKLAVKNCQEKTINRGRAVVSSKSDLKPIVLWYLIGLSTAILFAAIIIVVLHQICTMTK